MGAVANGLGVGSEEGAEARVRSEETGGGELLTGQEEGGDQVGEDEFDVASGGPVAHVPG